MDVALLLPGGINKEEAEPPTIAWQNPNAFFLSSHFERFSAFLQYQTPSKNRFCRSVSSPSQLTNQIAKLPVVQIHHFLFLQQNKVRIIRSRHTPSTTIE